MLTFDINNGKFNYRVVAVIIKNDRVLLHIQNDVDYWTFPGGRCEFFESSEEAINREIFEELHSQCRIERPLWCIENFFVDDNKKFHEISMYYKISLPEKCDIYKKEELIAQDGNTKLQFKWIPIKAINDSNIKPKILGNKLVKLPEKFEHIIFKESN